MVGLLTDLCNASTPPLHAPILLATALRQLDRVKDGFAVLKRHKENFRSEKDFLFAYVEIGYAAGEEHEAALALKALDRLRETGELDPMLFRLVSLDDLIDLGHRYRERQQKINSLLLRGQIPWTLAASTLSKAPPVGLEASNARAYLGVRIPQAGQNTPSTPLTDLPFTLKIMKAAASLNLNQHHPTVMFVWIILR